MVPNESEMWGTLSHPENRSPVWRGHNSAFMSHSSSDGFSIDVRPNLGTLVISGMVILEVLTEGGPVLVSLDLRAGIDSGPQHLVHAQSKAIPISTCLELPEESENKDVVLRQQMV
jgi:hypothetical protein